MAEHRQIIRGTTLELDAVTFIEGMRAYDTELKEFRLYDGVLLGGYRVPNLDTIDTLFGPPRLTALGAYTADANTAVESGFYRTDAATANTPVVAADGTLFVLNANDPTGDSWTQIWQSGVLDTMFMRKKLSAGAVGAWIRVIDQTYGDTRYLALAAQAADSLRLNGQLAAYYENIIARLGYTPANKAGDTFTGAVIISAGGIAVTGNSSITGTFGVSGALTRAGNTVWDSGNDGAGSGLDADLLDGLQGAAYQLRPVGSIIYMSGNAAPSYALKRNGALVSRATYADLWTYAQASGNIAANDGAWTEGQFSPGDGATTFRLPDDRGRFHRLWDDGRGIDTGRAIGSSQADDNKPHTHTGSALAAGVHNHGTAGLTAYSSGPVFADASGMANRQVSSTKFSSTEANHTHVLGLSTEGTTESRPANISVLSCIVF